MVIEINKEYKENLKRNDAIKEDVTSDEYDSHSHEQSEYNYRAVEDRLKVLKEKLKHNKEEFVRFSKLKEETAEIMKEIDVLNKELASYNDNKGKSR